MAASKSSGRSCKQQAAEDKHHMASAACQVFGYSHSSSWTAKRQQTTCACVAASMSSRRSCKQQVFWQYVATPALVWASAPKLQAAGHVYVLYVRITKYTPSNAPAAPHRATFRSKESHALGDTHLRGLPAAELLLANHPALGPLPGSPVNTYAAALQHNQPDICIYCQAIYCRARQAHLQLQRLLVHVSAALPQHHPAVGGAGRVGGRVNRLAAPWQQRASQARLAGHHLGGAALLALHGQVAGLVLHVQKAGCSTNSKFVETVGGEAPIKECSACCTAQ
jgi:hypothetical protein